MNARLLKTLIVLICQCLALFKFASLPARAYSKYGEGCSKCHGSFSGAYTSPKGVQYPVSLHELHKSSAYMAADCSLCHTQGSFNVYLGSSTGAPGVGGYGCSGCHARLYEGVPWGLGLRAYHAKKGIYDCAVCHTDDKVPLPENIPPPYYGTAWSKVISPCPVNGSDTEDWNGDLLGLDNDGDGYVDLDDTDCKPCKDKDGHKYQDAQCNPSPATGGDCDGNNPNVNPQAQEVCNGVDDNSNGLIDEQSDRTCDDFVRCTADTCIAGSCIIVLQNMACTDDVECTIQTTGYRCKHLVV